MIKVTSSVQEFASYCQSIGCMHQFREVMLDPTAYDFIESLPHASALKYLNSEQKNYVLSLKKRSSIWFLNADFFQLTIRLSNADSKDFFISSDFQLIYDSDPKWIEIGGYDRILEPRNLSKLQVAHDLDNVLAAGGLLSFSHFCGRNLASIIIFYSKFIQIFNADQASIFLPFLSDWQKNLIKFSIGCEANFVNSPYLHCLNREPLLFKLKNSWLCEEIENWESIAIAKTQIKLLRANFQHHEKINKDQHTANLTEDIVCLSRYRYEILTNKPNRVLNAPDIFECLRKLHVKYIWPECLPLVDLHNRLQSASLVICEAGSCFMNYLLLLSPESRVIQFCPAEVFRETSDFYVVSPIQWFVTSLSQIHFLTSVDSGRISPNNQFSWNNEATYSSFKLVEAINHYHKALRSPGTFSSP